MAYRLFDFSSDVGVEGQGKDLGEAFVGLARALAHVLTSGSRIEAKTPRRFDVDGADDVPGTAVAFVNELVFLFDTHQFLVATGSLTVEPGADGKHRVRGTLRGERFDPKHHQAGRGVKAATYHEATHEVKRGRHRVALILDL